MKKYKNLAFIFLIIVIVILLMILYSTISTGKEDDGKAKALSEVEFLERKFETLLNQMNNIETRNYSVSVSEISQETKSKDSGGSSGGGESEGSGDPESGEGSSSKDKEESGDSGNSQESEQSKKYNLEPIGVLTNSEDINWGSVKNEVEMLYTSIPTITLDLYSLNVAQDDVLGFNKEFDTLTISAKAENKVDTLASLARLYEYIPKFMQHASDDEVKRVMLDSKTALFRGYSKLDGKNWTDISQDIKQSIDNFSKLLSNTKVDSNKQYKISKCYVMLNELQNAVKIEDESIFLIKYKNILEELNNL